jgi:hypothetical protein
MGAYEYIINVGDWGWLIGAAAAGSIYRALSSHSVRPTEMGLVRS